MSYAIKLERGNAKIVNTSNGTTVRVIPGPFTGAVAQGNEAHLSQPNGKVKIVNILNGATIRVI
jgi:hypothetical protein